MRIHILLLILAISLLQPFLQALSSDTYCILDAQTGDLIKARQHLKARAPASTVKLLTAIVVVDRNMADTWFSVSRKAAKTPPTQIGLREGERMKGRDLLTALLLRSANDSAVVLAEGVAGSVSRFSDLMNERARSIGCKNSHFITPNGLPADGQYSCAYDLALIALKAKQYPVIKEILRIRGDVVITTQNGRDISVRSHNYMLRYRHPVYGKTGWTIKAGHTFAGYSAPGEYKIAIAVMGANKRRRMWDDLAYLVNPDILETPDISVAQQILKQMGFYTGKIDGISGPKTRAAVKQFQRQQGLKVDGIIGKNTWRKLRQQK